MIDPVLWLSPNAAAVLRRAGWSPERAVDISEWAGTLRREGNDVFPIPEAILRNLGGLRIGDGEPPKGARLP
jgi:hypothetical protein